MTAAGAPVAGSLALALLLLLAPVLSGCVEGRVESARQRAAEIAERGGLSQQLVNAPPFTLLTYGRDAPGGDRLVVYIEGDGLAWINRGQVSDDPTPEDPVALRLAAADEAPAVLYLARPCQFVGTAGCPAKYWTGARFAPEVVEAANQVIDSAKRKTGKSKVELIGYSGGGVLAALLAARRNDAARVIAVAANLDLPFWTAWHGVAPLTDSLSPTDAVDALGHRHLVMLVGGRDEIVPPIIAEHFRARLPAAADAAILSYADFSHECCWAKAWPALLRDARAAQ